MAEFGRPPPFSGVTDYETLFDYGTRVDSQPVYIGQAPQGSATSVKVWLINFFEYDAAVPANRVTRIQAKVGAWADRATLF